MKKLLVAGVAVLLGLAAIRLAVVPTSMTGYVPIDDYNVAIAVIGGEPVWRAVTALHETTSTVEIAIDEIRSLQLGAGLGDERIAYVAVRLNEPLGSRQVVNRSSGALIPLIRR